jgi:hypothetical protein
METGLFIIARWALTFGVPLAVAAHQLVLLRAANDNEAEIKSRSDAA